MFFTTYSNDTKWLHKMTAREELNVSLPAAELKFDSEKVSNFVELKFPVCPFQIKIQTVRDYNVILKPDLSAFKTKIGITIDQGLLKQIEINYNEAFKWFNFEQTSVFARESGVSSLRTSISKQIKDVFAEFRFNYSSIISSDLSLRFKEHKFDLNLQKDGFMITSCIKANPNLTLGVHYSLISKMADIHMAAMLNHNLGSGSLMYSIRDETVILAAKSNLIGFDIGFQIGVNSYDKVGMKFALNRTYNNISAGIGLDSSKSSYYSIAYEGENSFLLRLSESTNFRNFIGF